MYVRDIEKLRNRHGYIDLNCLSNIKTEEIQASNAIKSFILSDGKIFFKNYSKPIEDSLKKNKDWKMEYFEVLYYAISKKYGFRCAKYDFAKYKDMTGTISYDLNNNPTKKYCTLTDFIWKNFIREDVKSSWFEIESKYSEIHELTEAVGTKFNKEDFLDELLDMVTLDLILGHSDKQPLNIMVETDLNGQSPHLYSIDSSHILTQFNKKQLQKKYTNFAYFYNGLNEKRQDRIYSFIQHFNVADVFKSEPLIYYKRNAKLKRFVKPIIRRNRNNLLHAINSNKHGKISNSFNFSERLNGLKQLYDELAANSPPLLDNLED